MRTKPFETIVRREYLDYLVSENERLKKELVLNKLGPIHLHNCYTHIKQLEEKLKLKRKKLKDANKKIKILKKQISEVTICNNS